MPNAPEAGDIPPEEREPQDVPAPGPPEEALRRLEQRLDRASEAAERLMAQVAGEAVRARKAPGAGDPAGAGQAPGGRRSRHRPIRLHRFSGRRAGGALRHLADLAVVS